MSIKLKVNGKQHEVEVSEDTPLLWVLRDHLGLTGTKFGCGVAQCGACTVHIDGKPRRACVTPVAGVGAQAEITTIEGVQGEVANAVREAWVEIDVPQCGYCQSGQIMSAVALLEQNPNPDDDAIDAGMSGNLCRCATYMRIRSAIKSAAKAGS
ncbi:(2Fe-2S)-binding protein [Mangrovimicrobium sediminis]|uniref:(2Fe-2S)-binding protein n=1 Tax=Mangrovimicrobium sediminis TaxID=2562682 RepID=A0A4Z0M179_9GAMM|nr:(2Fe-2S)-binding protein [Haliea sp. SAOS-164]TGD73279.1 (2Fe-2S)-binding protein [Haliea sp. SAOS-164]